MVAGFHFSGAATSITIESTKRNLSHTIRAGNGLSALSPEKGETAHGNDRQYQRARYLMQRDPGACAGHRSELVFNHSSHVYQFGALTRLRRGLTFDRELRYGGAMFHDMGLRTRHRSNTERVQVDDADTTRDLPRTRGTSQGDIDLVWIAIALRTTRGIPVHMHPVVALVSAGVEWTC